MNIEPECLHIISEIREERNILQDLLNFKTVLKPEYLHRIPEIPGK